MVVYSKKTQCHVMCYNGLVMNSREENKPLLSAIDIANSFYITFLESFLNTMRLNAFSESSKIKIL